MLKKRIYALSIVLMTDVPTGPGWYIAGTAETDTQGGRIPPRKITPAQAEEIGRAFESVIPPADDTIGIHPFEIIKTGGKEILEIVNEELAAAEEAASRVAMLRRTQKELNEGG